MRRATAAGWVPVVVLVMLLSACGMRTEQAATSAGQPNGAVSGQQMDEPIEATPEQPGDGQESQAAGGPVTMVPGSGATTPQAGKTAIGSGSGKVGAGGTAGSPQRQELQGASPRAAAKQEAATAGGLSSPAAPPHIWDLQAAIEMLSNDLASPLRVAELAHAINMSPSRFAHVFKEATGVSPHRFRKQLRLERARYLLDEQNWSVTAGATEVGYTNVSHFISEFKRIFRRTPGSIAGTRD